MNNGNFLNSLLGVTGATPAVAKASAAKARAESTEKFQQAFEQARPEIAARKPAARREIPAADVASAVRSPQKPEVQRAPHREVSRADSPAKTRENVAEAAAKPEKTSHDKAASEPVEGRQTDLQSAESQQQTDDTQQLGTSDKTSGETPPAVESLLADSTMVGEIDGVLGLPENMLSPVGSESLEFGELADEDELDPALAAESEGVVDPAFLAIQPSLTQVAAATNVKAGDTITPLMAGSQGALGLAAAEPIVTDAVEGDLLAGADAEMSENPDFFLLNSKAAFNKLAESAMTAVTDSAAPAVDTAKTAAVGAAFETLTRLAEAQSPAARGFVVQTGVQVPLGTPQWSQAVGDKVLWLAAQNVSAAEIRLDPPELGPMQVRVSVNQEQASVSFTSPHPAVREALDQQLNRLREMFSEQGLNLVNVDVSDKSFSQRDKEESAKHQGNGEVEEDELAPVAVSQAVNMRLVDHYA